MPVKWSIDAGTRGHQCLGDAKRFASPQLVWTGWWTYDGANWLEGHIEPEIKRNGPTRVRCWCINASVKCDPRQNENRYAWNWRGAVAGPLKKDRLFSPRLPEMETKKPPHLPFSVFFAHRLYRWASEHTARPLFADLSPYMHIVRSVPVASIKDQLGYLTDQLWYRRLSTLMASKALKWARRCQSIRKLLFSLAQAQMKCGKNGLSMHAHWGICVRQTPKVLRVCSSFGRAGEPTIAFKWGGGTNRARNKALWTH